MGVNIHLKPTQVWPFFEENQSSLGTGNGSDCRKRGNRAFCIFDGRE